MNYRSKRPLVAACAAIATFTVTSIASAQVESQRSVDGDTFYDFKDDDLLGAGLGPMGSVLKVRKGAARVQLLRPRTHFVPEMLKSVEHI